MCHKYILYLKECRTSHLLCMYVSVIFVSVCVGVCVCVCVIEWSTLNKINHRYWNKE